MSLEYRISVQNLRDICPFWTEILYFVDPLVSYDKFAGLDVKQQTLFVNYSKSSYTFLTQIFVKATVLLKNLLKCWFDEIYFGEWKSGSFVFSTFGFVYLCTYKPSMSVVRLTLCYNLKNVFKIYLTVTQVSCYM